MRSEGVDILPALRRSVHLFAVLIAALALVACRAPEVAERTVQRVSITTNYALGAEATMRQVGADALHVDAATSLDAAFVQGYATAHYKLGELLVARWQSRGLARDGAGVGDRLVAGLDLRGQATTAAEALKDTAPDALSELWAYAHGVNAALIEEKLRRQASGDTSSEDTAAALIPWDAEDSLAILLYVLMAQSFDVGGDVCGFIREMAGVDARQCGARVRGGVAARANRVPEGVRVCHSFGEDEGMQAWFSALPTLRWEVELGGGTELDGWAPAGLPWFVVGTNGTIAWALAGGSHDVTDLFYLSTDPDARRVPFVGAPTSVAEEVALEERRMCEADESMCDLRVRQHPEVGIIVNELLPGELRRAIDLVGTFSVNWSGLGAQLREAGALSDLMEAGDLDVARSVLEKADTGAQRWLVASREAGSEWVDVGRVPSRPRPALAARGGALDGRGMDLWQGYIPAQMVAAQAEPAHQVDSEGMTCWRLGEAGFLLEGGAAPTRTELEEGVENVEGAALAGGDEIELPPGFPRGHDE